MPTPAAYDDAACDACLSRAGERQLQLARIIHLYLCEQWSTYRIATLTGDSRQRITRQLRRVGVDLRPRGAGGVRPGRRPSEPANLADLLRTWYVESRMSSVEIADKLGIPQRRVRTRLAEYGITRRTRGALNREDRHELPRDVLDHWYTDAQLPAADVGAITATSRGIVLRNAHDLGVPVRIGGPPPRHGPAEIALIDALYADARVAAVITAHQIPVIPAGGPIWQRFPQRVPLTTGLLRGLYCDAGVSTAHIELLTGHPAITVTRCLRAAGVKLRPASGRCPFLHRWRIQSRAGQSPPPSRRTTPRRSRINVSAEGLAVNRRPPRPANGPYLSEIGGPTGDVHRFGARSRRAHTRDRSYRRHV